MNERKVKIRNFYAIDKLIKKMNLCFVKTENLIKTMDFDFPDIDFSDAPDNVELPNRNNIITFLCISLFVISLVTFLILIDYQKITFIEFIVIFPIRLIASAIFFVGISYSVEKIRIVKNIKRHNIILNTLSFALLSYLVI